MPDADAANSGRGRSIENSREEWTEGRGGSVATASKLNIEGGDGEFLHTYWMGCAVP